MKMWKISLLLFLSLHINSNNANLGDLAGSINDMVRKSMNIGPNFQNLGEEISRNVQSQLSSLSNLGNVIQNQVNSQLQPVYAMEVKNRMINGVGGITTVIHEGRNPRNFIIQNGVRSMCNGFIQGRQCMGTVEPFAAHANEDFCYANSYAAVNDQVCLSFGGINVQTYYNKLVCTGTDPYPVLQLSRVEYQDLCGINNRAIYTYYANPNDPSAVPIPNENPNVNCMNRDIGICVFEIAENSYPGSMGGNSFEYHYRYK